MMQVSYRPPQQAGKSPLFGMFRSNTPDVFRKARVLPNLGTQPGALVTRLMEDGSVKSATYWGISDRGIPLYTDKRDATGFEPEQPTYSTAPYDYFAPQQPKAGPSRLGLPRESFNLEALNQSLPKLPSKPTYNPPLPGLTEEESKDYPALNKITAPANIHAFTAALDSLTFLSPEERLRQKQQEDEAYSAMLYGPDKGKRKAY